MHFQERCEKRWQSQKCHHNTDLTSSGEWPMRPQCSEPAMRTARVLLMNPSSQNRTTSPAESNILIYPSKQEQRAQQGRWKFIRTSCGHWPLYLEKHTLIWQPCWDFLVLVFVRSQFVRSGPSVFDLSLLWVFVSQMCNGSILAFVCAAIVRSLASPKIQQVSLSWFDR